MGSRSHTLSAVLAGFVAMACSDTRSPPAISVRDSVGVEIVTNPSVQMVRKLVIDDRDLIVTIGGETTDTSQQLFQVEGAHVLSDGRIVVANRSSHQLRYYDGAGRFLDASGGEGDGPGEFRYIAWTARCGSDSVVAYDIGHRRAFVFDERGRYTRAFELLSPDGRPPYGPAACWGGSWSVLGWATLDGPPIMGYHRPEQEIFTADANGALIAQLGPMAGTERWGHTRGTTPAYFAKVPVHAMGPSGTYVGTGDHEEIAQYAVDATLTRIIRWSGTTHAITPDDIDRLRSRELANARSANGRRSVERRLLETEFPDSVPAYERILVDVLGNVWVKDYAATEQNVSVWSLFDDEGRLFARVEFPARFRLFEVGADYVIGVWQDESGLEYLFKYRLSGHT